jgi:AcrR family transcriptional regulator
MLALAQAAGIPEAILYVQFGDKTLMFKEAVEINTQTRLRSLNGHFSSVPAENQIDWIESMAEATMMNCLPGEASAILMNWALLEAPEFATHVYRNEIGSVRILWEREAVRRFPASRTRELVSLHVVPQAVNTCLAHGLRSHGSSRPALQNRRRPFSGARRGADPASQPESGYVPDNCRHFSSAVE